VVQNERGWDLDGALDYYLRYTRPMYEAFVKPSISYASAVLDGESTTDDTTRQVVNLIRGGRTGMWHTTAEGGR